MYNKMWKKGLVIGIIVLLVEVSVLSIVSSKNVTVSNEKMEECNPVSVDNPVSSPTDNYTELITYFDGTIYNFKIEGIGLLFHIEMWSIDDTISMNGYRYPLFPLGESVFCVWSDHVVVPNFIGYINRATHETYGIHGIALGNVEWS